jgi:hypothetical protein
MTLMPASKIQHPFKALVFGDGDRGTFFQIWQSEKYPNLQCWVFGVRGKAGVARQFRVKGWDPEIRSLADAVEIAKSGKRRRCVGLAHTYFHTGPMERLGPDIPVPKLRGSGLSSYVESGVRRRDPQDKRAAGTKSNLELSGARSYPYSTVAWK